MADVIATLEREGVEKFEASWLELLDGVKSRCEAAKGAGAPSQAARGTPGPPAGRRQRVSGLLDRRCEAAAGLAVYGADDAVRTAPASVARATLVARRCRAGWPGRTRRCGVRRPRRRRRSGSAGWTPTGAAGNCSPSSPS